MNDELERDLRALLADRAAVTPDDVDAARAYAGRLPSRHRRPRTGGLLRVAAVLAVVAIGGGALAVGIGTLGRSGAWVPPSQSPTEGDPDRWAQDPRLLACTGVALAQRPGGATATAAFEMQRARDYRRHLPAMGRSPELEVDDPALVTVFQVEPDAPRPSLPPGEPTAPPTDARYDVCIVVGPDPAAGLNYYPDVDVTGLAVTLIAGPSPTPPSVAGTRVALEGRVKASCDSIGGCAYFVEITGEGSPRGVELAAGTGDPSVLTGSLAGTLAPGTYDLTFTSRPVSDEVIDGEPLLGGVSAECALELVLAATREEVAVTVWFGRDACTAESSASPPQTPWYDAAGEWRRDVSTNPGPGHCDWDGTIWLGYEGNTFIRDPLGVLAEHTAGTYHQTDAPPPDARDSGLSNVRWRLFLSDDRDFVYMRTVGGTFERWARDVTGLGCT